MGERDKLRQFRELDDAFAAALRELEPTGDVESQNAESQEVASPDTETPEVKTRSEVESPRSAAPSNDSVAEPKDDFGQRLETLMAEYEFSNQDVRELLETLQHFRKSA
ncbi:hypothetical protein [Halomonas sp.]|nr:hypothetical protein [Halomonas sp.]